MKIAFGTKLDAHRTAVHVGRISIALILPDVKLSTKGSCYIEGRTAIVFNVHKTIVCRMRGAVIILGFGVGLAMDHTDNPFRVTEGL